MKHSSYARKYTLKWPQGLCVALALVSGAGALAQVLPVQVPPVDGASYRYGASRPVADRYVVIFKAEVENPAAEAASLVRAGGGQLLHTYQYALKGFAATLPEAAVQALRRTPRVESVEPDQTISLNQTSTQNDATWGLDRIDQVSLPLNTQYVYNSTGVGVTAFIIDTGILATHNEFTGRVGTGYTVISDGRGTTDCHGHGTHVAGTVGGVTYGVAKAVALTPVRVLNCSGSGYVSGVIAGVDWVAGSTARPAVANMSLGGGLYTPLNTAVAGAVAKGVTMVVAAGNDNADACRSSPASEPSALTVGATTSSDARASFSNYGTCVDIFAPGTSITSAWYTSISATNTISGTSMATPHVAGVAALVLSDHPDASPAAVGNFLKTGATAGVVTSVGAGSPNLLIYSLATGTPVEPTPVTIAVKSITGRSSKVGTRWRATVTVTMRDLASGGVVPNVQVSGSYAPGGTASCTTGSTGSCSLSSALINRVYSSTTFTVTGASGSNMVYDSGSNVVSQITVARP